MHDATHAFREAIAAALGPDTAVPDVIEPNRWHRFSANGKRGDTSGWCWLFNDGRGGVFGCHRQGISETWSETPRATMTPAERYAHAQAVMQATAERERTRRAEWAANAERNARLWAQCVPLVPGDPVTLYLKRRGFAGVWPLPTVLRYHRALPYWHEGECIGTLPAMVAPLMTPEGCTLALHRTFLTRDGRKADVPTVRKLTKASGPLAGAAIPLFKPVCGRIGIAEGAETALAAWLLTGTPTVAAYCAGNLAAYRWPAGVQRLVIFGDNDAAGTAAAAELRERAQMSGLHAQVLTPTDPGADWCDVSAARSTIATASEGAA